MKESVTMVLNKWNRLTTRKPTKEETANGYTFIWCGQTPEIGEEVLVTDGESVWVETWMEFDTGVGFEYTAYNCWWMPFPKPPVRK